VIAFFAAAFGDIALDAAVDKGFDEAPLEEHQGLAAATIIIFSIITLVQTYSMWRGRSLAGTKAVMMFVATLVGLGFLIATAYHGGQLVYEIGVNVTPVKP